MTCKFTREQHEAQGGPLLLPLVFPSLLSVTTENSSGNYSQIRRYWLRFEFIFVSWCRAQLIVVCFWLPF